MGVFVFAATNIDDILLLALFFADRTIRPAAVVAGQFIGIGVLTAVSGGAALLALAVPPGWIGLLGLVPLFLGVRGIYALWRSPQQFESGDSADLLSEPKSVARGVHAQWISVALVTVANGGDNLGAYIPLFSRHFPWIPLYAAVFTAMTFLWCAAGYWLVKHPLVGKRIGQYGHIALPFVLVALGLLILSDARALF
jgi:cadmium resistance protein CadD (predicted permease)